MPLTHALRGARRHIRWPLAVAVLFGLVLMLPGIAVARGNPNKECATSLIAKFEAKGSDLVFEKGGEGVITIVDVDTDDEGELVGFEWTASVEVGSVIVKGGQQTEIVSGDSSSIEVDAPPAISNVQFCAPDEPDEGDGKGDDGGDEGDDGGDEGDDGGDKGDDGGDKGDEGDTGGDTTGETDETIAVGGTDDMPVPTRIDAGAGGVTGPSFEAIMGVLALIGVVSAAAARRLARARR